MPTDTDADLQAVARKLLPGIARDGIKLAVGYAKLSKRDVSGLGDVAEEARLLAEEAGRATVIYEDVERAINEQLMPSDAGFEKALNAPVKGAQRQPRAAAEPLDSAADSSEEPLAPEDFPQRATRPANLDGRNVAARAVPGSHRQTFPAFVPV